MSGVHRKTTVEAIFEDGVFKPVKPPKLAEGQRVQITVERIPQLAPEDTLQLALSVYQGLSPSDIEDIEDTSNSGPARRRSSPFFRPAQPRCGTVWTSCPVNSTASFRGRDSSRRMRIRRDHLSSQLQSGHRLFARYGRVLVQEHLEAVSCLEIVEQNFYRDSGSDEHGRPPEDLGVSSDDLS